VQNLTSPVRADALLRANQDFVVDVHLKVLIFIKCVSADVTVL
jgi:hypothetical protein